MRTLNIIPFYIRELWLVFLLVNVTWEVPQVHYNILTVAQIYSVAVQNTLNISLKNNHSRRPV